MKLVDEQKADPTMLNAPATAPNSETVCRYNYGYIWMISLVAALGGLMATTAQARGMAGIVADGGVRDVAEIRALGLPIYARSVTPATAVGRFGSVAKQIPVTCGGVVVKPGDIIVADEDGVVRVPQEKAAEVLAKAKEIDARELKMVPMIRKYKSLQKVVELFNRI
jgi:regulator of RNase E activity RraA